MNKDRNSASKSEETDAKAQGESRIPRSIRFSDSEWEAIEKEANKRNLSAAVLVRVAALQSVSGETCNQSTSSSPEMAAYLERIFRAVYLLATIRRDEFLREGRREELENIHEMAKRVQKRIRKSCAN